MSGVVVDRRLGVPKTPPATLFTNDEPSLAHGWHVVCLSDELVDSLDVLLLGSAWTLNRCPSNGLSATPAPAGLCETLGLVWMAPAPPDARSRGIIECDEYEDGSFPRRWLEPARTGAAAALLADNFLDLAHFPFVHAATIGFTDDVEVPRYDIQSSAGEFTYRYQHLYKNEEDPGVALGLRPLIQNRTVRCTYRWPFQMTLTLEHIEAGGTTVLMFFLQPESASSTRVYTCVLRRGFAGDDPELVDAAAFEQTILDEDLRLQEQFDVNGLPLDLTAEVHVRCDSAGIQLRRVLAEFLQPANEARASAPAGAP